MTCDGATKPEYNDRSAFEEYRYDALGRRVLVRTRTEFHCLPGGRCRNAITRVVWDGDQLLYEISSNGATDATVTELEKDTGQVVLQNTGVNYFPYGRVVYTHGAGLDAPMGLLRMNYSNIFPEPILVVPLTNWQGQYDLGIIGGSKSPAVPDSTGFCRRYPNPITSPLYCFVIDWPAPYMWKTLYSRSRGAWGPRSWNGSLIEAGRDGSGQMYRRNRYYDPATGRFTQEDPIGLAGGLNLYGFANGDPINYSDPFGLKADTIKIQWHKVAAGQYHASIRITPNDQARWANNPSFKGGSVTLGAGPKGCLGQGICLVSDLNRKTDVAPQEGSQVVDIGKRDENHVIEQLLRADAKYGDNLQYDLFPTQRGDAYNSNSYTSGILLQGGIKPPPLPVAVPGWDKPIRLPFP